MARGPLTQRPAQKAVGRPPPPAWTGFARAGVTAAPSRRDEAMLGLRWGREDGRAVAVAPTRWAHTVTVAGPLPDGQHLLSRQLRLLHGRRGPRASRQAGDETGGGVSRRFRVRGGGDPGLQGKLPRAAGPHITRLGWLPAKGHLHMGNQSGRWAGPAVPTGWCLWMADFGADTQHRAAVWPGARSDRWGSGSREMSPLRAPGTFRERLSHFNKLPYWDCPGGPVDRAPPFHCRGLRCDPWSGN